MLSNVINTILFCLMTILLMICISTESIVAIWLSLLGSFVFNQAYTYYLFIKIMLYKKTEPKVKREVSEEEASNIYKSLKKDSNE